MIIDRPSGPIGIAVSGGADSALLLYYLMSQHDETIHIYTRLGATPDDFMYDVQGVENVIKWCSIKTQFTNYIHTSVVGPQAAPQLFDDLHMWRDNGKIMGLYSGITANPPHIVQDRFGDDKKMNPTNLDRDPRSVHEVYNEEYSGYFPFANIDKQKIAEMYRADDLMDLFDLTSSCNWTGAQPLHCGHCWCCKEREWGFGRL